TRRRELLCLDCRNRLSSKTQIRRGAPVAAILTNGRPARSARRGRSPWEPDRCDSAVTEQRQAERKAQVNRPIPEPHVRREILAHRQAVEEVAVAEQAEGAAHAAMVIDQGGDAGGGATGEGAARLDGAQRGHGGVLGGGGAPPEPGVVADLDQELG